MGENSRDLALKYAGKTSFELAPVLEWMEALNRARTKAPGFFEKRCYFTRRSFEQASSEATAHYKATRIKGNNLLNLCGGIGIDDAAFSGHFERVVSLDPDETVHDMAVLNMEKMGLTNVERRMETAENFIEKKPEPFDWVYADPDRRSESKRVVSLSDCSPDLVALWPAIQAMAPDQLVKLSPLYPLEHLPRELKGLKKIEVVASGDEVKEVLAFCSTGQPDREFLRAAVVLDKEGTKRFEAHSSRGTCQDVPASGYFYDVHAAIAKAGLGVDYAMAKGTHILIPNGLFQFSEQPVTGFMGRRFHIETSGTYSQKSFRTYLKERNISRAHFNTRFFHSTPEELKAAHRIGDGGDDYFFFFKDRKNQTVFIHGTKF